MLPFVFVCLFVFFFLQVRSMLIIFLGCNEERSISNFFKIHIYTSYQYIILFLFVTESVASFASSSSRGKASAGHQSH